MEERSRRELEILRPFKDPDFQGGAMRQTLYLILGYLVGVHTANAAETFSFDMPQPRLRVVVPDIPQIKMGIHPNAALQPHARFMGTDPQGFSISILMPTADAGMSPRDCARTMHKSIMARFRVRRRPASK